jgi:hypothetical protein
MYRSVALTASKTAFSPVIRSVYPAAGALENIDTLHPEPVIRYSETWLNSALLKIRVLSFIGGEQHQ